MDLTQPQDKQHCPDASVGAQEAAKAAGSGEQAPSEGAQSHGPALHSPCPSPGPSPTHGAAQPLSGQPARPAAPEPKEGNCDWSPPELYQWQKHMEQEISQGEVTRLLQLSEGENNSDKTSLRESWGRITIRTIWVNPQYPELLQNPLQEEAKAAAPASGKQVPAAEAQSCALHSPSPSPCSSRTQLAAQTLSDPQGVHGQPSSPRRVLQALCTLLWCSCMEAQMDT